MARNILLTLVAVSTVAACGARSSGGTASADSGLYGVVRIIPGAPACRAGTTCARVARGFRLVFARRGHTVTTKTDLRGRYRVRLAAGYWAVHAASGGNNALPKAGLAPSAVGVPAGRFARRNFTFDVGIR